MVLPTHTQNSGWRLHFGFLGVTDHLRLWQTTNSLTFSQISTIKLKSLPPLRSRDVKEIFHISRTRVASMLQVC
jgi:hypothetical protein